MFKARREDRYKKCVALLVVQKNAENYVNGIHVCGLRTNENLITSTTAVTHVSASGGCSSSGLCGECHNTDIYSTLYTNIEFLYLLLVQPLYIYIYIYIYILIGLISGVPRNFVREGGHQIQLRTEDRENGYLGAIAP